jgi:hypothetical protein
VVAVVEPEEDEPGLADRAALTGSVGEESHATSTHETASRSTERRNLGPGIHMRCDRHRFHSPGNQRSHFGMIEVHSPRHDRSS